MENVFVFIEILFKMLLFQGGVLIYAEHCIYMFETFWRQKALNVISSKKNLSDFKLEPFELHVMLCLVAVTEVEQKMGTGKKAEIEYRSVSDGGREGELLIPGAPAVGQPGCSQNAVSSSLCGAFLCLCVCFSPVSWLWLCTHISYCNNTVWWQHQIMLWQRRLGDVMMSLVCSVSLFSAAWL